MRASPRPRPWPWWPLSSPGDDVSEDDVYNICYTIFENMDALAQSHDKGKELDLEFAAGVTAVPYHAGAARYFAEKGFEVPTK